MAMFAHPHPDQRDDHTGRHQRQIADGRKATEHKGDGTDDDGHRAGQSIFAERDGRAADDGGHGALDALEGRPDPVVIFNGVVDGRHDGKGDDGGNAQADGRADAAQRPGHLIAEEQSDVRHHDAGQALAHGDELQQIALGHPAALVHKLPLHLGDDAPSAAEGERADLDKVKKHQQGHSCAGGALLCGFGFCCLHESS